MFQVQANSVDSSPSKRMGQDDHITNIGGHEDGARRRFKEDNKIFLTGDIADTIQDFQTNSVETSPRDHNNV